MSSVFVTVGMGPWPFDRLVRAVEPQCAEQEVVVQRPHLLARHRRAVDVGELW